MEIQSLQVIKDGGSARIVMRTGEEFYIDNRLSGGGQVGVTKGEIYTGYPSTSDAEIITDVVLKRSVIQALEDYGRGSALYNTARYVSLIESTMSQAPKLGYTISKVHSKKVDVVEGYTITADNGDSQYLTSS